MENWKRTFRVVYAANLVTAVGMMSFLPFFPSYLVKLGLQDPGEIAMWSGLVFGAAPLVAAFMGPVWGSLGDRLGRKLMLIRALAAIMIFVGCMGFVTSPGQLLALRIGQGVFSGFVPPSITLVSIGAPPERQGRVAGSLQTALAAGSVLGPLVGAILLDLFGIRSMFWFVAGASGLSALAVLCFAHEDPELRAAPEVWTPMSLLRGLRDDIRALYDNVRVRRAAIVLALVYLGIGAGNPLLELYAASLWSGDPALLPKLVAALFTVTAGALLLTTPLWGRLGDRIGHGRAMTRAGLLTAVALLAHALAPGYWFLLAARVLLGATASGPSATAFGLAGTETSPDRRGAAFGAMFSARAFAVSIGAISGGAIASLVGIRSVFIGTSVLLLAALLLWSPPRST